VDARLHMATDAFADLKSESADGYGLKFDDPLTSDGWQQAPPTYVAGGRDENTCQQESPLCLVTDTLTELIGSDQ